MDNPFALMTPEFQEQIEAFKKSWYARLKEISDEPTPRFDGNGKPVIEKKGNYNYITDEFMTAKLSQYFPGWSWIRAGGIHFSGSEWITADGELLIIDEGLLAFNINPPIRRYWAADSVRIQYKQDAPHIIENVIDIGDNVQSALTGAKKRAINRLCGIGDDIYGKQIELENAGNYEEVLEATGNVSMFNKLLKKHKILTSIAFEILKVSSYSGINNYWEAWNIIKKAKGIK